GGRCCWPSSWCSWRPRRRTPRSSPALSRPLPRGVYVSEGIGAPCVPAGRPLPLQTVRSMQRVKPTGPHSPCGAPDGSGSDMKTQMSRFHIHDDLTAPEGSVPVLKGALATGGQLPNFLGVLAGSPAALRAYARFRSELRRGKLELRTLERIALAVAEHHGSEPGIAL